MKLIVHAIACLLTGLFFTVCLLLVFPVVCLTRGHRGQQARAALSRMLFEPMTFSGRLGSIIGIMLHAGPATAISVYLCPETSDVNYNYVTLYMGVGCMAVEVINIRIPMLTWKMSQANVMLCKLYAMQQYVRQACDSRYWPSYTDSRIARWYFGITSAIPVMA